MRIIYLSLLSLFMLSCHPAEQKEALTFIPMLTLNQGKSLEMDMSVYMAEPGITVNFKPYLSLNLKYDRTNNTLSLSAGDLRERLHFIRGSASGKSFIIPVQIIPMVEHTFTYEPSGDVNRVVVMGGFNDWSRTALPMLDNDGDGILERTVYLAPQRHEYKFVVDGKELIDPVNPVFISNNIGGWNSILDLSMHRESPPGHIIKKTSSRKALIFEYLAPDDGSKLKRIDITFNNELLPEDRYTIKGDQITVFGFEKDTGVLRILAVDIEDRVLTQNITRLVDGSPITPANNPDDWHFAIIYNIMVDRFLDGNQSNNDPAVHPDLHPLANFQGGDLAGIMNKLNDGYLQDLGINALWISPLQKQPDLAYREWIPPNRVFTGYHGYWPIEARKLEPRFGTAEEFKHLVDLAHGRGIRVLLDFVSNHVHEEHHYYKDHPGWFGSVDLPGGGKNIRNWSEETRLTTWFDEFIPSFDYPSAPEAVDSLVADALWWLKTFNLDGFRQDAVKHVPHSFWKGLGMALGEHDPDTYFYQIGETFGSDDLIGSYVNPLELSAQFNFSIYFNARGPFSSDKPDFAHLSESIASNIRSFGPVHLMGNITSSHDQLRFMSYADNQLSFSDNGTERSFVNPPGPVRKSTSYQKLKNFHAFNFALPGVPVIYYGEEIGLMGAGDPDNRRMMRFGSQLNRNEIDLKKSVSEIIGFRRKHAALSIGDWIPLSDGGETLVFLKSYFDDHLVVVIHQGLENRDISFTLPVDGSRLIDLKDGDRHLLEHGQATLTVSPYSYHYFRIE